MADPIPLREWTPERRESWYAHLQSTYKPSTVEAYLYSIQNFDTWRGNEPINAETVGAWLTALDGLGYASRTVALRAHALRALRTFWVAEGVLPGTEEEWPSRNAEVRDRPRIVPLSSEERSAIRYAASQLTNRPAARMRDAALIGCLLDAGPLRVTAMARLPIQAVEWPTPRWTTPPPLDQIQAATRLSDPVTGRSTRLSAETGDALARYLWSPDGWQEIRYKSDGPRGQFLWPALSHRRAQRPITRQGVFHLCRLVGERAGISRALAPDLLRLVP